MRVQQHPLGGYVCTCEQCGAQARVVNPGQFAQAHRCTHRGMGDLIAQATKAVGIQPCTPCEERRRQLNGMFPRVWRR
jgi:hypothetical protein